MTVGLIWAEAANGVIGAGGTLPWHLPEDMALFREVTAGATVVMGRATWDSLPRRFRPLPGRRNVVLSRRAGLELPGAHVTDDLMRALDAPGDVWVIGGAAVYEAALPYAHRLVRTRLEHAFDGDVRAPVPGPEWRCAVREPRTGWHTSRTGLRFAVTRLVRDGSDA